VLGDLLGSVGAVLAALAIRWMGWNWADPVLSLLVSLLILNSAWRLLRLSAHILLEGVPDGMDRGSGKCCALCDPSIRDVHHLHVWQLASGSRMATLHAELHEPAASASALLAVNQPCWSVLASSTPPCRSIRGDCFDQTPGCVGHGHPHFWWPALRRCYDGQDHSQHYD
jgi:cobalt-zinc-cadmium efflux system protein